MCHLHRIEQLPNTLIRLFIVVEVAGSRAVYRGQKSNRDRMLRERARNRLTGKNRDTNIFIETYREKEKEMNRHRHTHAQKENESD